MELSFQTHPLHFLRCVVQEVRYQEETAETIVPDSYPDIAEIADCYANIILRGKDCRDGSVTIAGGIKGGILYTPEDHSHPRSLDFYMPFTVKFEKPGLTEHARVLSSVQVRSVDARIVNSRKAMLRVNLGCEMTAYEEENEKMYHLLTDHKKLQVKRSEFQIALPVETGEKSFAVRETLELPSGQSQILQICKANCTLNLTDQKLVGNKAVFKGTLFCKLLYLTEDGMLRVFRQQLPFSQYCEMEQEYDEETVTVLPVITGYDLETETEEYPVRVQLSVNLLAQCIITALKPIQIIEDAYCLGGSLEADWKHYEINSCLDHQNSLQTVRQVIPGKLHELVDADLYLDFPSVTQDSNRAAVSAPVNVHLLGYDENGNLRSIIGKGEAVQEFALAGTASCRPKAAIAGECSTTLLSEGTEFICKVQMDTACHANQGLRTLCAGTWTEEDADTQRRPSVIIRTAPKNADLWEIAKASRTSEDMIRAANHLEGNRLKEDSFLLIPIA